MNRVVRNSLAEANDTPSGAQAAGWPVPFVGGLILGVMIALVAAARRWLQFTGPGALPQNGEVTSTHHPASQPVPAASQSPGDPLEGKPLPSTASEGHRAQIRYQPGAKIQKTTSAGPESPREATARPVVSQPPPTRWKEPTKYIVGIFLFLALLVIVYMSRSVIPTVIVAALLALIVHPVIGFFQRGLKLRRGLAIAITYLLIIGLLILIPVLLIPSILDAVNDLINLDFQGWAESIADYVQNLSGSVAEIPIINRLLVPFFESVSSAFRGISSVPAPDPVSLDVAIGSLVDSLGRALGIITSVVGPVVSAVITVVFMLLISLHLSLSGQSMLEGIPHLLPPRYATEITALGQRIGGVWLSFLRGQFALMVIIGLMVWLGNALLGNRYPLLLGLISGILEVIPNLGPALALIPGVGFALIFGSSHFAMDPIVFALVVLVFYLLVQVFENQLIVPYVLGGELDVPPVAVLLGVMVGGTVAGILGVLLATPFIAMGREVFRYLYDKILEAPEDTTPQERQPSFLNSITTRIRSIRIPFRRRANLPPAPGAVVE